MIRLPLVVAFALLPYPGFSQTGRETMPCPTLPEQSWWNLLHYTISIRPDYLTRTISGSNEIEFRALRPGKQLLLDLLPPMKIRSVRWHGQKLDVRRTHFNPSDSSGPPDAWLIHFPRAIAKNELVTIDVSFDGHPKEAIHAPWDGGWIWAKDSLGRPWISLACEDPGGMLWLPCKNAAYDEPDSGVTLKITVPDSLVGVGNGRLIRRIPQPGNKMTYEWSVTNPINNYDICPYIVKYVTWHHDYPGMRGNLDCDYWVLDYNREKAAQHLTAVDTLLKCFEYWMGPYPFYKDSYKVVEAPMAGMEHQSAIAYGNGFEDGYRGKNLSGTVWGLKWDFILVHESGHEWFGNSITANGFLHGWIHEGFAKYLETLYTAWVYGDSAGDDYALGIWKRILNDQPIIGSGTSDKYNKGCALLHMIRQIVGDSAFRRCLHALNTEFFHSTIATDQVLACINRSTGRDFSKMFAQYLTTTQVPILEYRFEGNNLAYRWTNCVEGFNMPVKVSTAGDSAYFITPNSRWQKISLPDAATRVLSLDRNFYCTLSRTS